MKVIEIIKRMSIDEAATYFCERLANNNCDECPATNNCWKDHNGFKAFLETEDKEYGRTED